MKKNNEIYLHHILDAISLIEEYLLSKSYSDFISNHLLQDGVIRQLEIIGEASKRLSKEFIINNSEIPWKEISGMRDKLIHDYFGVDIEAVWDTANNDLTNLKNYITKIIKTSDSKLI